ncbi:low molecular weight phosphatase family protein [Microbacterium sp. H1-D42]|uniref:arsenate reductase/protein-tyrosine-phosphatase family protein n=1 Tax=Microbacterium sp. H1-D42 TaxID=2925844 RepID=UPI001F52B65A|nr:low molecular weight phosphatase family protein [Microbacterium sp. H1-D42]UNK70135.1 low molecular weight phosphatase family protein [Microbacterium sp. H1-D42]
MPSDPSRPSQRPLTRRERRRMEAGAVPRILTVCTGNICRSPLAEVTLRAQLRDLPVQVHSAGTNAMVGHGMTPQAAQLAINAGADPADADGHQARYLVEPMLLEADLVLTMTREHRDAAVQLTPSRFRQVLPLREFGRLAAALPDAQIRAAAENAGPVPSDRVAAVVAALVSSRTSEPTPDDDIIDPYRQPDAVYQQSADEMLPAIREVERVVRLALA